MTKIPIVSVIVPNYNHEKYFVERMDSILSQTFRDFEVLILDDCSTDNSRGLIEKYRDHELVSGIIFNETNSGSAFHQWKKGIEATKGKYIWIAESDDFCDQNFLEIAVQKLEQGFELFYAMTVNTDESGKPFSDGVMWMDDLSKTRWRADFSNDALNEVSTMLFLKNTIPNASAVLFRRNENVIPYLKRVEGMRYCGDWIFWMLYLAQGGKIYYSVATKNYFRSHAAVSRRTHSHKERNQEVNRVLRFVLNHQLSKGRRKEIVAFYFENHYYRNSKRNWLANGKTACGQIAISIHFLPCWLKYYFSSK